MRRPPRPEGDQVDSQQLPPDQPRSRQGAITSGSGFLFDFSARPVGFIRCLISEIGAR
jgi:hypothetical protein